MPTALEIHGLKQTQANMILIGAKIQVGKKDMMMTYGKSTARIGKQNCEEDTGALRRSINRELMSDTPQWTEVKVFAGDPSIIRGEGEFAISSKTNKAVTPQATTQYALHHENNKGYMNTAYQWAKTHGNAMLMSFFRKVIRGI